MIDVGVDDMDNTKQDTLSIIELTQKCYDSYKSAFLYMRNGKELESQMFFHQGDEFLLEASRIHARMLSKVIDIDFLIVHAEDLLISVQLYKSMFKELAEIYNTFPTLKGNKQSS